jgi:hypothetical protein
MNSRSSRSHRSFPGGAYGAGLSSSYGSGLGTTSSAGYSSFSSGYSPSYTSYSGYLTGASRPGYSTAPSLSPVYNNTGSKYIGGGYTAASLLPPTATSSSSSYTSKRYSGAKTDSDLLTNGLGSAGGNPSSWRSKSTDPALTNGYRERSLSRDPSTAYNYEPSGDGYAASASRASAARDHYSHHLGRAERSPSLVSSRECRAGSFSGGGGADSGITDGSLLMSPPRVRKPVVTSSDYLYRSTPPLAPPAYDSASRFSNATASLYRPSLSRSNSFHDLREGLAGLSSPTTPKAR